MSDTYCDSLIDCTLVIGVDEYSGLKPSRQDIGKANTEIPVQYQQHILAAISSSVAIFPFSKSNHKYPPEEFRRYELPLEKEDNKPMYSKQLSINELHIIHDLVTKYNKTDVLDKITDPDFALSLNRRASKYQSRRKSIKVVSIDNYKGTLGSVSIETIKSFPGTYFNNNLKISKTYVEPKIEILPMTDNMGSRSYAFRLEFYRHFITTSETSDESDHSKEMKIEPVFETDIDSKNNIFIPCNIIFFSKYPYFNLFQDIFSQLFLSISNTSTTFIEEEILEYSSILTRVPIMQLEKIQINFSIDKRTYSIKPNNPIFEQITDWDMSLLFQVLSIDDIIFILTAMFQDQKIAFFSKYRNTTTIICETLMVLFQPFTWKHFYLSVVPTHLYELVDAIFPFLIGLPHNMKEKVINCYDDIIIVDLDEGTIKTPKNFKMARLSQKLVDQLKLSLRTRDWMGFRHNLSNISPNSLEDLKTRQYNINKSFSEYIMLQFMMMMVDLFREILVNISIDRTNDKMLVTNLDKFLNTSHSENIEFFKSIHHSDNLNCFLESKLDKMDYDSWVKVCDQLYPDLLADVLHSLRIGAKKKNSIHFERDVNIKLVSENQYLVVNFPTSKSERKEYYTNLISRINQLENITEVRKLEIEIHLQSGKKITALELIEELLLEDKDSLNAIKVRKIVRALDEDTRKQFERMQLFNSLNNLLKIENENDTKKIDLRPTIQQFYPPNINIPKNKFYEICKAANITDFESIADCLFKCLTLNQKPSRKHVKLVPPELFQCFYNTWIQYSSQFNEDDINLDDLFDEVMIFTSSNCEKVDDFGLGRILLTQMRLLFIPFGKKDIKVIIDFTNEIITKIKPDKKMRGFGRLADVLEITKANQSKKILIWLPKNIEIWYNLISEVSLANKLSNEEKDKTIIDKMTDQCLVYDNLVNCSRKNTYFKKHGYDISKTMLTFSTSHTENTKNHSNETFPHRKYLISKLMPSPKQIMTIDCAAIICDQTSGISDLWCGLSNDDKYIIKIFEIINESFQPLNSEEIEFMSRIKFMFALTDSTKMVVGCNNGTIYLIDPIKFEREEFDISTNTGSFATCGVCHESEGSCAKIFLGGTNGELLTFDHKLKELHTIMTAPNGYVINFISSYDARTLVLGSSHAVLIVTDEGVLLSIIETSDVSTIFNRISYLGLGFTSPNIMMGLARLPVLIEYDISNAECPIGLRKKNLLTNKDFNSKELAGNSETLSKNVGISSVLSLPNEKDFWVIYKDGTVEIRDSQNLVKIDGFQAHNGAMVGGLVCKIKNKTIFITLGKDDGKAILWNLKPS